MRLPLLIAVIALAAGCQTTGTPDAAPGLRSIGSVQGPADRSPIEGQRVTVEGVVVGDFGKGLGGVFIQSLADDGDPLSAEGLFLAMGGQPAVVLAAGDRVRATGTVKEIGPDGGSLTSLVEVEATVLARGVTVAPVRLAGAPVPAGWEAYEGMQVQIDAPLTVTGNDGLARFGELFVSFAGRRFAPTERAAPGLEADALAQENFHVMLRLDDGLSAQDPGAPWFLPEGLDDARPLRTGSVIGGATGVLDQRFGSHRLQLTAPLRDVTQAPRPPAPRVPGDRRLVGLNVLNLFNGDGQGGGFPTERGAASADDHARQQAKLVATLQALDPDLVALMELENDGFGPDSALARFVAALNAAGPHRDWRFVDAGEGPGDNSIRVGMVYRATRIAPVGRPASLKTPPFDRSSRAPLAQAFRAGTGPTFLVVANHFKSKGGCRPGLPAGDADQGDGQACFNATRVASAEGLHAWLATDPTGTRPAGQLIIGDLNAHAQEDPLRALYAHGWRDAFEVAGVDQPYSYVWAGLSARLDHALLDAGLAARLRGAAEWHNSADESERFGYDRDDDTDPWRASDHDPVVLGFDLGR
ncbi:MAG TPA: ExeM/NucH family extracellular endonuclease [Arenimonas sp.]|uniref:ExeM/NucH family extracellular endonuclease n=1 Tax=Arenimonas sp. TaxID=1872635 RepID=UPI002D7F68D0|nr:ExeM/NucH family extracellular endonuclease [Arenimonas sp.]HEU0153528.1 ExeM/NucH family extracellular endonuclease [Arenimonas sp.]